MNTLPQGSPVTVSDHHLSPDSAWPIETALEELCRTYWFPLYSYVRRRAHSKEDAEDLTQGFFARFLEKNYLAGLSAQRGRFRALLLAALKHFLANEGDKAKCFKRGGQAPHLSLDWATADARFQIATPAEASPEVAWDFPFTTASAASACCTLAIAGPSNYLIAS